MGNSEVGHNALGAGQVISQGAALVDNALAEGSMFTGEPPTSPARSAAAWRRARGGAAGRGVRPAAAAGPTSAPGGGKLSANPPPAGAGWEYIAPTFASNTLHFIGLLSDGGVHSRTDQLFSMIRGAAERGAKRIRLHILTDGRDVPDGSSIRWVPHSAAWCASYGGGGAPRRTTRPYTLAPFHPACPTQPNPRAAPPRHRQVHRGARGGAE